MNITYGGDDITEALYKLALKSGDRDIIELVKGRYDELVARREYNYKLYSPTPCKCGAMAQHSVYTEPHSPYMSTSGFKCESCGNEAYYPICGMVNMTVDELKELMLK